MKERRGEKEKERERRERQLRRGGRGREGERMKCCASSPALQVSAGAVVPTHSA